MTEAEQFAICDQYEGNTMIAFERVDVAMRYALHRHDNFGVQGLLARVDDTRTGSGLCVMWRDPVEPDKLAERLANCRWLLEEILAGRKARPIAGEVNVLWDAKLKAQ